MQTIRNMALIMAVLCILTGCNVQRDAGNAPDAAPTDTASAPVRVDMLGNPIKTSYADGTFVALADGVLTMESGGSTRGFALTDRAKNDITSLGIQSGMRIIVNYNVRADGVEEAESIEKIIVE